MRTAREQVTAKWKDSNARKNVMYEIVLIRHGESEWNRENRFTGWADIGLTLEGEEEAREAGRILASEKYTFDLALASTLKRAIHTLRLILREMNLPSIPVSYSWRLNERHYGSLEGIDKEVAARTYGKNKIFLWRRSYTEKPPAVSPEDVRHPIHDVRYCCIPEWKLPSGESLQDVEKRVVPYWKHVIVPSISAGKRVIIASHNNTLRALIRYLEHMSEEDILSLTIPRAVPLVYQLDENVHPLTHRYRERAAMTCH